MNATSIDHSSTVCCGSRNVPQDPIVAGAAKRAAIAELHFGLFCHLQRIVNLYSQVPHRTLDFRVPEKKLNGTKVLCFLVDQGRFRPSQRMGPVVVWIQSNSSNLGSHDSRILARRQMRRRMDAAGKQKVSSGEIGSPDPRRNRLSCLVRNLKLHGSARLLLHHHRTRRDLVACGDVRDLESEEIAGSQFAVNCKIE